MDKNKLVGVVCLYEGVVECFDKNNENYFDVENILSRPLLYLLGGILGGQCIVHHGYMNKIV